MTEFSMIDKLVRTALLSDNSGEAFNALRSARRKIEAAGHDPHTIRLKFSADHRANDFDEIAYYQREVLAARREAAEAHHEVRRLNDRIADLIAAKRVRAVSTTKYVQRTEYTEAQAREACSRIDAARAAGKITKNSAAKFKAHIHRRTHRR